MNNNDLDLLDYVFSLAFNECFSEEIEEIEELKNKIENLNKENKKLKDENFKLDYQNTRIKGALFEFEMNYYQDNLKESNAT